MAQNSIGAIMLSMRSAPDRLTLPSDTVPLRLHPPTSTFAPSLLRHTPVALDCVHCGKVDPCGYRACSGAPKRVVRCMHGTAAAAHMAACMQSTVQVGRASAQDASIGDGEPFVIDENMEADEGPSLPNPCSWSNC